MIADLTRAYIDNPRYYQVNLLFVVDEVSDDQNGKDARSTGKVFVNAMQDPDYDDRTVLSKITKEYVSPYCCRCSVL